MTTMLMYSGRADESEKVCGARMNELRGGSWANKITIVTSYFK